MTSDEPLPGRCGAECRDGGYCTQHPVQGRNRCRMHGGTQPRGMDSPNAIHGLRSEYLDEDDEEIYDEVRQHGNAELIQEEIYAIKTKLLRAAREAGGNDAEPLVRDMLADVGTVDEETIAAMAKVLQVSQASLDRALGRLNDLVKTHHKITEGESVTVQHSGHIDGERTLGEQEREAIREGLASRRSE